MREIRVKSHDETKVEDKELVTTSKERVAVLVFFGDDSGALGKALSVIEKAESEHDGDLQATSVPYLLREKSQLKQDRVKTTKEEINKNFKRDKDKEEFRECFLECEVKSGQGAGFKGRLDKRTIRRLRESGGEVEVYEEEEEKKEKDKLKAEKEFKDAQEEL